MIRIKNYLNEYLPEDIRVLAAEEARPRFHSRLNALSKTYIYRIETADKMMCLRGNTGTDLAKSLIWK